MKKLFFSFLLCVIILPGWAQTYLTPNKLGSGNLPGTYDNLVFTLSNGNWTSKVSLPATGKDKAKIKIVSNADFHSQVLKANTDVPLSSMGLARGQTLAYEYSAERERWLISAPTVWAANDGKPMQLSNGGQRVVRAQMRDGAWAPSLNLPSTAIDGAIVLVNSYAPLSSRIDPVNVLHASTMPLRSNDNYAFVFNADVGKWVMYSSPETRLSLADLIQSQMPEPVTALTRLEVTADSPIRSFQLPSRARDRDRLVITSSDPLSRRTIESSNVEGRSTMTIGNSETYEFMWNADNNKWVVMRTPRTRIFSPNHLIGNAMPPTQTPVTELLASDNNWLPAFGLPQSAQAGDRIVVKSVANSNFRVISANSASPVDYTVNNGEEVVFLHTGQGWTKETDTIRILLTYSQGVSAQLGASAARTRQLESLRLTNQALENSGARFRFQLASLIEVPNLGATLGDAVRLARSDTIIQTERERVKADAVYYEGVESGCGTAWVNRTPDAFNMVATGSTACGTTVMRHELGHNMGLDHGNGIIPTAMSGNAMPYFATPTRFDATLRVPMGHLASVPDEVAIMNRNAPIVARFR